MNTPHIEFLGWDKPAIELVATKLKKALTAPESASHYRRAIVVVPTAESGRRLREHLAEQAGNAILTPRIILTSQLISYEGADIASEMETLAAWLQVLSAEENPVAKYAPLIPRCPDTNRERWAVGVAHKLIALRTRLEQEQITCNEVTSRLVVREQNIQNDIDELTDTKTAAYTSLSAQKKVIRNELTRWRKLEEIFNKVDSILAPKTTRDAAARQQADAPGWPGQCRLMILACLPELSPQMKSYLANLHGKDGGEVQVWVHAPAEEASHFDAFGIPVDDYWSNRQIDIPNAIEYKDVEHKNIDDATSTIHLTDDAESLAEAALRLAAGYNSQELVLAVGDAAFSPALVNAFAASTAGWKLNLPEGRSAATTDLGCLVSQLADACAARENLPLWDNESGGIRNNDMQGLDAFIALLYNSALQQAMVDDASTLAGLQEQVEKIRMLLLPGSEAAMLKMLREIPVTDEGYKSIIRLQKTQSDIYADYADNIAKIIDIASGNKQADLFKKLAKKLEKRFDSGSLKPLAAAVAQELKSCAEVCAGLPSPRCAVEILRQRVESKVKGPAYAERAFTAADILGWRELPYTAGSQVIIAAMHDGAIPEPVSEDEFLPKSLCDELGIRHEKFRIARDSYLLTSLIESRRKRGRVDFILARQKSDGSVLAPSSLLMRCGEQLPERARALFAESTSPKMLPKPAACPLRRATGDKKPVEPGCLEHISQIAPGMENPFTKWRKDDDGNPCQKSYSPSSLSLFLQCPLSFWIKNLFHIDLGDTYKENKGELESNEYGTVMHAVLDKLVKQFHSKNALLAHYPMAETNRETAVEQMLEIACELAGVEWRKVYNSTSARHAQSLPMEVQLRAIERSLRSFLHRHIQDLLDGWYNVAREYTLTPTMEIDHEGTTVSFSMNADRIDRHADGRWRIIDYKTSSGEKNPHKVHFDVLDGGNDSLYCRFMNVQGYEFGIVPFGEKLYRWNDVQLPLYVYGLRHPSAENRKDLGIGEVDTSAVTPDLVYYNLQSSTEQMECFYLIRDNKVVPKSDKAPCEIATEDLLAEAMKTVKSAIRMIRAGECLFSAEALELTTPPYSPLNSGNYGSKTPRFGALSLQSDPRSLFDLPGLAK